MNSTQKTIRLYRSGGYWMAQFVGDAETMRLFGTDSLPTPFTDAAPFDAVYRTILRLNPGSCVDTWSGPVIGPRTRIPA